MLIHGFCAAQTTPEPIALEKRNGGTIVRLPVLADFAPACEESPQLANRAAGLTPKTSEFITCLVPARAWRDFKAGTASDLYPFMSLAILPQHPSGNYTSSDFVKLEEAARKQLGSLLTDGSAQGRLAEQEKGLAQSGTAIRRDQYRLSYSGMFSTPQDVPNFAYVTTRSFTLSEGGTAMQLQEVVATSVVLHRGRLLMLLVVGSSTRDPQGVQVREVTSSWLQAYSKLN